MKAKNRMRKFVALICIASMLVSSYGLSTRAQAEEYRKVSFQHFGIENNKTYPVGSEVTGQMTGVDSLDGYSFEGTLTYGATTAGQLSTEDILVIGGKNYWAGLQVYHSGSNLLLVDATRSTILCHVSDEAVGKTYVNTPFDIRLCFKYENNTDVRLGFWVDGVEYYNEVVEGLAERIEPKLLVYAGSNAFTLGDPNLKITYETITSEHFGIENNKTYPVGSEVTGQMTDADSLDGYAFEGTLTYGATTAGQLSTEDILVIGGKNYWAGLQVYHSGSNLLLVDATRSTILCHVSDEAVGKTYVNTPFDIRLCFKYENNTDVRLGFWVDGVEYYNEVVEGLAERMEPKLLVYAGSNAFTLGDPNLKITYETITSEHFGIENNKTYPVGSEVTGQMTDADSLDGYAFEGTLTYGATTAGQLSTEDILVIGGKNYWAGLQVYHSGSNLLLVDATRSTILCHVSDEAVGKTYVNTPFDIRLCFKYENNTDVRLGFWVDGVEYYNEVVEGLAERIEPKLLVYAGANTITLGDPALREVITYDKITFEHFGIENNRTYRTGSEVTGQLTDVDSLDGYAFEGTLTYGATTAEQLTGNEIFVIGGKNYWTGIQLYHNGSRFMLVDASQKATEENHYGILCQVSNEAIGKTFLNTPFDIRLCFKYVNDNDVRLGFWIDGVEYYSEVVEGLAERMEPKLLVYAGSNAITLGDPALREVITYEEITFGHFEIENGTYPVGSELSGQMTGVDSLDGYAFEGTLTYGATTAEQLSGNEILVIGGKNYWSGIQVYHNGSNLLLVDASQKATEENHYGILCHVSNEAVGKTFLNTPFDIRICFKYENDTDVRLGFWVDGVEYYSEVVEGLAERIEPKLLVYAGTLPVTIKSSAIPIILPPIDFAEFGFSERWAYTLKLKK